MRNIRTLEKGEKDKDAPEFIRVWRGWGLNSEDDKSGE